MRVDPYFNVGTTFRFPFKDGNAYSAEVNIKKGKRIHVTVFCRNPVTRKRYQERHIFNQPEFNPTNTQADAMFAMLGYPPGEGILTVRRLGSRGASVQFIDRNDSS